MLVAAFSGGSDSTAMILRMAELNENPIMIHTPTGNEMPGVSEHISRLTELTGFSIIMINAPTLEELIKSQKCLPNWRMRFCTRMIKIEPTIEWLELQKDVTLCIGLRADEEGRDGLYGNYAAYRYPLREWGWNRSDVEDYLEYNSITVPIRTDCALCFFQRLGEWKELWLNHPDLYRQGEIWEEQTGYTFRSPGRDKWPAALKDLKVEFENGRKIRKFSSRNDMCRICSL